MSRPMLPDYCLGLKGLYHAPAADLVLSGGGAGVAQFPVVPAGFMWVVDMVGVSGGANATRVYALYRSSVSPDTFLGAKQPIAALVGDTFDFGGAMVWLRPGERLVLDVAGALAAAQVFGTAYYRLYEIAERGARPPRGGEGMPDESATARDPMIQYPDGDALYDREGGTSQDGATFPAVDDYGRPEPDPEFPSSPLPASSSLVF